MDEDQRKAIEAKAELREWFLEKLHWYSRGNTLYFISADRIGADRGLDQSEVRDTCRALQSDGFVVIEGGGGWTVRITGEGVRHVERPALSETLKLRQDQRKRFLRRLYEVSNGSTNGPVDVANLRNEVQLDDAAYVSVRNSLTNDGFIRTPSYALGGANKVQLTPAGARKVEADIEAENQPPAPSPTPSIHMTIGTMTGSQVQVATIGSHQAQQNTTGPDLKEIGSLLSQILAQLAPLPEEDRQVIEADIETLRSQLKSPRPKLEWIHTGLLSLRDTLVKLSVSAAATYMVSELPKLTEHLIQLLAAWGS